MGHRTRLMVDRRWALGAPQRRGSSWALSWMLLCVLLGVSLGWAPKVGAAAPSGKLVVIVMENEPYGNIVGNSQAPYLNQLMAQGQLFTNYTAVAPASNPNYLAMTSGLTSALSPPSPNIFQAIDGSGTGTWKEFMESMPGNCAYGISTDVPGTSVPLYTADHDPDYQYRANTTCSTNDVPMTTSTFVPASLPSLSYVVPNECDDMHTLPATGQACPAYFGSNPGTSLINMGDNWLAKVVPSLLAQPNVTVVITWDEGSINSTPPQHIVTLEAGAGVTAGARDGNAYTHYGLEAGLYRYLGLGTAPNNGATATPLPILSPAGGPAPTVTGVSPNTGSSAGGTSVTITGTNFSGVSAVQFGTVAATGYTVNSATQITATSPAESASTVNVSVTTPGGTSAVNAPGDQFTFSTSSSGSYYSLVTGNPALLAYWRLGETSGTTANDTTGKYNGTYVNGPTLGSPGAIAGDPGTSVTFNGTNQRVTLPSLPPAGDFSIEGWTYLTNASVNDNTLYGDRGTVRLLARPGTESTAAYAGVTLNGTEYVLQPNSPASNLNTWVYWVLTRQGGTLTLYRDGVQIAQRTDLPATATANINGSIADQTSGDYYLNGRVDDVALYNAALSSADVTNKYEAAVSGVGPPPPAPTVTGVSPNTGSSAGGTSVTITGTNFSGVSAVQFGTVAATGYTVNSATQITATSPAESASTVNVSVTTPGGTSAVNAPGDQFTFSTSSSGSYYSLVTGNPALLAYWRLGETSGTTANDTTGKYNGTYVNGPTLGSPGAIAGDPGTSVTFNGTNQRVTLPSLPPAGDFSIEGWTYLTNASVNDNTLYGDRGTVRLLARPGTESTAAYAGVTLNGTEYVLQPNSPASNLNTWVYWVLTRQGGTLTLYRDGVQIAQRTDLPATATANINGSIADQTSGDYYLNGRVDDVALYTSALTPSTVASHYQAAL